jgi:hypothetical protein
VDTVLLCHVKVLSRSSESDPYGWWPARLKMMKGEFAVVDYVGYESTYSEIVSLDRIRLQNKRCADKTCLKCYLNNCVGEPANTGQTNLKHLLCI